MSDGRGHLTTLHVGELHESPDNPREITDEAFEGLKYALEKQPQMLDARPIIATTEGEVVCGNMRLRAARSLNWEEVPVYVREFESDSEKREWMLRDNNEYGSWVPEELRAMVAQHEAEGADLQLLGFSDQERRDLLQLPDDDALPGGDEPPEPIPVVFGVVIDCEGEDQQAELLEEFETRGLECRALMA